MSAVQLPGGVFVEGADAGRLALVRGPILDAWGRIASNAGVAVPSSLFELLDALDEAARRARRPDGSATGSAPVPEVPPTPSPGDDQWVDTAEAARRAGITDRAIRKALKFGRLRGRQVDGKSRWLVDPTDLARFIENRDTTDALEETA